MTTRRTALLAIPVLGSIVGILGAIRASGPDRDAIRDALTQEMAALDALDVVRKDRRIEELMAVEDHQTHARALWLKLERMHGPAHQAAKAEEAARRAVPPFLARTANLDQVPAADLQALDDEARALQNEHGSGRSGPALADVRARIAARRAPSCGDLDHFRLLQTAQKNRLEGRYATALSTLDAAPGKHPSCAGFLVRVRQEREGLQQSASKAAEKILDQARKDRGDGRKAEAVAALEKALPDFKGFPESGRLAALLTELRRP